MADLMPTNYPAPSQGGTPPDLLHDKTVRHLVIAVLVVALVLGGYAIYKWIAKPAINSGVKAAAPVAQDIKEVVEPVPEELQKKVRDIYWGQGYNTVYIPDGDFRVVWVDEARGQGALVGRFGFRDGDPTVRDTAIGWFVDYEHPLDSEPTIQGELKDYKK